MSHQVTITRAKLSIKEMKPIVEFSGIIDIASSNTIERNSNSDDFYRDIGEKFFDQIKDKILDNINYKV